ncbi:MAG TPA: hypothetical protein VJQ61_02215, partial [Sinomonas sp.]|nr:hypothetical protein [Sinomonas sp.]
SHAVRKLRAAEDELAAEIAKVADFARTVAGVTREGALAPDVPVRTGAALDPSTRAITLGLPTQAYSALDRLQTLLRELA